MIQGSIFGFQHLPQGMFRILLSNHVPSHRRLREPLKLYNLPTIPFFFSVTTYSPKFDVSSLKRKTEPPTFSIIEKEDTKFNPPLRVIGLRYHTTPGPNYHSSEDSSRSYTNFQDPEQVTMAFRTQEVK